MAKKKVVAIGILKNLDKLSNAQLESTARGEVGSGADYLWEEDSLEIANTDEHQLPSVRDSEVYWSIATSLTHRFRDSKQYASPESAALRTARCWLPVPVPDAPADLTNPLIEVEEHIKWLQEVAASSRDLISGNVVRALKDLPPSLEVVDPARQDDTGADFWEQLARVALGAIVPPVEDRFDLGPYIKEYERRLRGAAFLARKADLTTQEIIASLKELQGPDLGEFFAELSVSAPELRERFTKELKLRVGEAADSVIVEFQRQVSQLPTAKQNRVIDQVAEKRARDAIAKIPTPNSQASFSVALKALSKVAMNDPYSAVPVCEALNTWLSAFNQATDRLEAQEKDDVAQDLNEIKRTLGLLAEASETVGDVPAGTAVTLTFEKANKSNPKGRFILDADGGGSIKKANRILASFSA